MTKKIKNIFNFLDKHLILILAGILIGFIPLYPKIPLFSPIEEYIVRVRLEDLLIALVIPITFIQILRKKVRWHPVMTKLILVYAAVGLLSTLSAVFITKTVPLVPVHIGKTLLHYFRYLEYFSVFFVSFAAIRSRQDVKKLLLVVVLTIIAIGFYGYMQKFFYWPVYSTMNREFSKGIRLYLTEHARIQSTFAGHYDMAAFLVITLPLVLSLGLTEKKWKKVVLYLTFFIGSWLVVMSASRMPFAAYIIACLGVIAFLGFNQKAWLNKFKFWLTRFLGFGLMLFFLLFYFGQSMLDRLSTIISTSDKPLDLTELLDSALENWPIPKSQELYALLPKSIQLPSESEPAPTADEILLAQVASQADQPPTSVKPTVADSKPRDVYVDVPEPIVEEVTLEDGRVESVLLHKQRTFSDCALKHELSLCIRLESLWPWAIQSFETNPVLGTGYATLNKQFAADFTFADSTDNNYLRTLGETGLLGFLSFYGIIAYLIFITSKQYRQLQTPSEKALLLGFTAGSCGLLINAVYTDVFAASKVAYTYWLLAGLVLGSISLQNNQAKKSQAKSKK